ncbi:MAG: TetR/AcrR family transcriptional regulator [Burkholderiales bacterium]|jgi:AcrR family transcriptional regulator|nr:TetR/AcrR family transcriptional regulator [Burkholderiales bacterium]
MSVTPPGAGESAGAADLPAAARAPRRARGHLRVDALLAAAAEVFADKGFDAATMTEIAAQSGSSIGSLYQFFRTKEAVAEALLGTQVDALWLRLDGMAERAPALATRELGRALATCLVDFRVDHPSFATLVERPGPPSPLVAGVRRKVRERVEAILVRHAPHADRKALRAMAPVVQHVMKSAVQLRGDLEGADLKAAARELETMLAGYLSARLAPDAPR